MPPRVPVDDVAALETALDTLRHAAYELRATDPSEAVKVLRRLVKQGGEVEGLAHGALGEILLDEFEDVDAAIHHFQRLVTLAPALPAGHHGLARALAVQGDVAAAHREFVLAAEGLAAILDDARTATSDVLPPGLEEGLLTLYAIGDEVRALGRSAAPVEGRFGDWAEAERLFDSPEEDPDDEDDDEDWLRYGVARVSEDARAGGLDAGLAAASRIAALVPFGRARASLLRSHAFELAERFDEAASAALAGVGDLDGVFEFDEVARAAALLDRAGRGAEAKALLLRLGARLRRAIDDDDHEEEEQAALEEMLALVEGLASETGPKLVSLGRSGPGRR
jgi:hypothetical protein